MVEVAIVIMEKAVIVTEARVAEKVSKPGDWDCPECGGMNFASRTECFKCGAPKESGRGGGRGGGRDDRGGGRDYDLRDRGRSPSYDDRRGRGRGRSPSFDDRRGGRGRSRSYEDRRGGRGRY